MNISVAMAVYNGEQFIEHQIDSIIHQLLNNDELIISYNESCDLTWKIISRYRDMDKRIRIITCEEIGVVANFENAILHCRNELIFLSDQDDVWIEGKRTSIVSVYENEKPQLVLHGKKIVDHCLCEYKTISVSSVSTNLVSILIRNQYTGCCLAFKRELIPYIIPFPRKIYHDWWIAIITSSFGKIVILDLPLIMYRRHNSNASSSKTRSIPIVVKERIVALKEYYRRIDKLRRTGHKLHELYFKKEYKSNASSEN